MTRLLRQQPQRANLRDELLLMLTLFVILGVLVTVVLVAGTPDGSAPRSLDRSPSP